MINVKEFCDNLLTTKTIQTAIDYAASIKKVLYFPAGIYNVASLFLRDNSSLYFHKEAVISALTEEQCWNGYELKSVIYADGVSNISIRGGTICCNGGAFTERDGSRKKTSLRPEGTIRLRNCNNVTVENVKLMESIGWTFHLDNCEDVFIDSVIIRNPPYFIRKNTDGIDINGCRNVTVINCDVETGDDAICLKNVDYFDNPANKRKDMFNINVYNCTVASTCNGTKIGTETVGNIYDVKFENITVNRHSLVNKVGCGNPPYDMINQLSAISVQSNDGADVHDISFKNYNVECVDTPIFVLLQKRKKFDVDMTGSNVSNISIENITVKKSYRNSQIICQNGMKIKNINISGAEIHNFEQKALEYNPVLPDGTGYPDVYNYGKFPTYGIYSRNAEKIEIAENVMFIDEADTGRKALDIE